MATILLSAAGAAIGGMTSGSVLGLTGAVIGRAVGATLGRVIDQRLLGTGSEPVERGRVERFRISGAGEGAPVAQLFGRMRIGGQIIWATQFLETATVTGGGKGAPKQPRTTTYSYSISVAVALCEGQIRRIGRIWLDGVELDRSTVNMRVYTGSEDQMPDPLMEAVEGAGAVPAYRGIAYVVFEDLDLGPYGNRVPQFAFEVVRAAAPEGGFLPAAADLIRAVALMPGTGEYALATTPVTRRSGFGNVKPINVSSEGGGTDFTLSLERLRSDIPNLKSISLIYSWFGDDLRAGTCRIMPKVEDAARDGHEMPWRSGGITRGQAEEISRIDGRPVYGGTPADAAVIEAIEAIRSGGQEVLFYPFLLMEILPGNGLPDPYMGAEQAAFPWRGRITGDVAPGFAGTSDRTAANNAAVQAFFGTVTADDFTVSPGNVAYSGPSEWSYSRFILHCAALCAAAGGVDSFCIGSEMRGLTQMRDQAGFPAVEHLREMASEVRRLLPNAELSYAADWSEYFGYQPQDGSGDFYFHLDPLWADDEIDFIAIDNYMPLSDWRDGTEHADASWGSVYDIDYLRANVEGGEGYDWYYPTTEARDAQEREPIQDGAHNEPWVYRYKDLRGWWENTHQDRRNGTKNTEPPVCGTAVFDGTFENGADYWLYDYRQDKADLETAVAAIDYYSGLNIVEVEGEGAVLEARDRFMTMSERCWRPIVEDQTIRATLRTRVVSTPNNGQPHEYTVYIAGLDAAGNYAGWYAVANYIGRLPEDGWVESTVEFVPSQLRGQHPLSGDAVEWRLFMILNGWAPYSMVGAVQQLASITVEADALETPWVPRSKPIRFTEIGCPAIDKGTNQPNKFLDPKSSESSVPHFSSGLRDDLIQAQYLRAVTSYWNAPENNPVSDLYGLPMIDMARAHVWAWDARPWPAFPNDLDRWSDGSNWQRGHWVNGRIDAVPLDQVVAEICERAGLTEYDVSGLSGLVRGHVSGDTETARARLQALMLAYGFNAVERDGSLVFAPLPKVPDASLIEDETALREDGTGRIMQVRSSDAELTGCVRVGFTAAEASYEERVAEAVFPDDGAAAVSSSQLPLALTGPEGQAMAERWLADTRVSRDSLRFALPPSKRSLGAGSMIALPDGTTWRIDRVEDRGTREIDAIRVEPSTDRPSESVDEKAHLTPFQAPVPVSAVFMDLPLLKGDEIEHAPHLAVTATPWPGPIAIYESSTTDGFELNRLIERAAIAGTLETPLPRAKPGLWDRGMPFRVRIASGHLSSAETTAVLNGANAAAIGAGDEGPWEVIQFARAELVGNGYWDISTRLRGQQGTDAVTPDVWPVGSYFVVLDGAPAQIDLPMSARNLARHYRIGLARRSVDDASFVELQAAFPGVGLRPYSPVHLRTQATETGREITWIRRGRVDADSWEGVEVPLAEASETYLLRIVDAGGTRREELLSAPRFQYSAGMRAADGTASPYSVEVAQMSDRFGPGPFARIEIDD